MSNGERSLLSAALGGLFAVVRRVVLLVVDFLRGLFGLEPRLPVRRGVRVIRPQDLLILNFDWVNLRLETVQGSSRLVKSGDGAAYLIVELPPQNIAEKAFFEKVQDYPVERPKPGKREKKIVGDPLPDEYTAKPDPDEQTPGSEEPDAPPIDARIARPSRLVFRVPDDRLPIAWSLDDPVEFDLLDAMRELELSVSANALPPTPLPRIADPDRLRRIWADRIASASEVELSPTTHPMALARLARARRTERTVEAVLGLSERTGSETLTLGAESLTLGSETGLSEVAAADGIHVLPPIPAAPERTHTALETPWHLILSPHRHGAWLHSNAPVTSGVTRKTELWHTRLGVRRGTGNKTVVSEGADPLNTVRAVWCYQPEPQIPTASTDLVEITDHVNAPFRMSLDSFDRENVVHLSSNFRLQKPPSGPGLYDPDPVAVELFMLSSLGAWMNTRGAWEFPQPRGLSVEEWRHRATLGRDHYVRVVYAGFLFPFGHRASLVKITERKFHELPERGDPAYQRQRMFLVVREPVKTFRNTNLKTQGKASADENGWQYDLMMPFEAVRLTTVVSPNLDDPGQFEEVVAGKAQSCFWPHVNGQPFRFHLVATDVDGNRVEMAIPLIFVGKEETDRHLTESSIIQTVQSQYEAAEDAGLLRARAEIRGQKVAFAESSGIDDTAFEVETLTFGAEIPVDLHDDLEWTRPRFFPVLRKADIHVPSMQRIARTTEPSPVVYPVTYLRQGFPKDGQGPNQGEVFLAADPDAGDALQVKFSEQSERSGGFISPDLELSGLSRAIGPVSGKLETAEAADFQPGEYFGALTEAKLFGVFSLVEILNDAGFDEPAKVPRFAGQNLNAVERLLADLAALRSDLSQAGLGGHAAVGIIDTLTDAQTGSIAALAKGGSLQTVQSQLTSLQAEMTSLETAITSLTAGPQEVIRQRLVGLGGLVGTIQDDITASLASSAVSLLQSFAQGGQLPDAVNARFEWRPELKAWGDVFTPHDKRGLVLAVEAAGQIDGAGDEEFTVTASLDDFSLGLGVLNLDFQRLQFRVRNGKKPEIDVQFDDPDGLVFAGILAFIQTLQELLPLDGFADPPDVEVDEQGITASFSLGLPNIAVGIFSLENLKLAAGLNVPFVGPPLSVWFRFCERDDPALVTVSMLGGGFFFGLTLNADGLVMFEGAIEVAAALSLNFGVASGSVKVAAGVYFKIEGDQGNLAGYLRVRGEVEALLIVTISIEIYLELSYEFPPANRVIGTASITVEVEIAFFSVSVEISYSKSFPGPPVDPTFADLMDVELDPQGLAQSSDWEAYCGAFA